MRRALKYFAGVLVLIGLAAVALSVAAWRTIHTPYRGYEPAEQFVDIPPGTSTTEIGRRLTAEGVVKSAMAFRLAAWWSGEGRRLKAGEYRFDRPLDALEVVTTLARGDVYVRRITFPEGLTIAEMGRIFESQGLGPAAAFVEAARAADLVADLDAQASDLEGYLFPETYALPRGTPASRLVALMVQRFRAAYTPDLQARAEAAGFTTRQVVTLASLVEKETAARDERPIVAAVYRNRLKIGMGMQADPTVIYALQKAGRYDGNIRRADLSFDSPYNTYRYAGLPPGPIAAPGRASLEAAVAPADVPYLYFVSRNDGSHVFSSTLDEHNRNVRRYQVEYFRERRRDSTAPDENGRRGGAPPGSAD